MLLDVESIIVHDDKCAFSDYRALKCLCVCLMCLGGSDVFSDNTNVSPAEAREGIQADSAGNGSQNTPPDERRAVAIDELPPSGLHGGKYTAENLFVGSDGQENVVWTIDGDTELEVNNSLNVGGYGLRIGNGTLIQAGGTVETKVLSINGGTGTNGCGVYYGKEGTLKADTLFVGGGYLEASANPNGKCQLDGVSWDVGIAYNGSGKYMGKGLGYGYIVVDSGSLTVRGDFFNAHHMWSNKGTHSGRLRCAGGRLLIENSFFNGYGPPSLVQGVLEVCGNKGRINMEKDFSQIEGSSLICELSKPEHTVIEVKGTVQLGGAFKARLSPDYMPEKETWWDIIKGCKGSPVGTFSEIDFSEMPDPDKWTVRYDTDDCVFRVGYQP